uniref:Uncharacterized protein n=1 Tax=Ficedula albicollis TaxID=59894 RepID=A0A803W383_FICAL
MLRARSSSLFFVAHSILKVWGTLLQRPWWWQASECCTLCFQEQRPPGAGKEGYG